MFVRVEGPEDAPAVLLLHGQFLGAAILGPLGARLSARHRVLIPDLPGYGRSPLPDPYSLERVRAEIESALLARGVDSARVVAYSLGAYHALSLALSSRVRVERLALLGPTAGADVPALAPFREFARMARAGTPLDGAFVEVAIPSASAAAHPELVASVRARAREVAAATLAAEFDALAALPDLRPRLAALAMPVLLRVGAEDRNTPPDCAREIAARVRGARLEIVPGVGHLLFDQDEAGTMESVLRFLDERA